MPKVFTSQSQRTGELGESIAAKYLAGKGFRILERNYTRNCGEIDIVAAKDGIVHFIEVKSSTNAYRPEENMTLLKIRRLRKIVSEYLSEKKYRGEWQFGVILIRINQQSRIARVRFMGNIVI